jgi:hypothetical protein
MKKIRSKNITSIREVMLMVGRRLERPPNAELMTAFLNNPHIQTAKWSRTGNGA